MEHLAQQFVEERRRRGEVGPGKRVSAELKRIAVGCAFLIAPLPSRSLSRLGFPENRDDCCRVGWLNLEILAHPTWKLGGPVRLEPKGQRSPQNFSHVPGH